MSIRLSTSLMYQQSLNSLLAQQSAVNTTQNEVSSGNRITLASDDPTGAAQALGLNHILASNAQYSSSIDSANTKLSTESSTLTSMNTLLDRAKDLLLSAGDGSLSDDDRSSLATELTQIRTQLLSDANTTDANGDALFAGTSTTTEPFTLNADGSVSYAGNDVQSMSTIGSGLKLANSDAGSTLFMNLPSGNGSFVATAGSANSGTLVVGDNSVADSSAWSEASATGAVNYQFTFSADGSWTATDASTGEPIIDSSTGEAATGSYSDGGTISLNGASITLSGTPADGDTVTVASGQTQDMFTTLNQAITALQGDGSDTEVSNVLNRSLESLNQAQDSISDTQVQVGSRLSTLSDQQTVYSDLNVTYQSALSDVQDTDAYTAISKLSLESTALEASQQVFAKVQALSLFNYIS